MKPKNRNVKRYIRRHYQDMLAFAFPHRLFEVSREELQTLVWKQRQAMFAARGNG